MSSIQPLSRGRKSRRRNDLPKKLFPRRSKWDRLSVRERFDEKWMPEPNTGCWLWLAQTSQSGYGQMNVGGESKRAHRVAWELYCGPIPPGMVIDHICRQTLCVNPDHLRVVTPRVNALENSASRAALNAQKERCPRCGDSFRGRPNRRYCLTCKNRRQQERRDRLRKPKVPKASCKNGHPFSVENTGFRRAADGTVIQRVCRACARYAWRKNQGKSYRQPRSTPLY